VRELKFSTEILTNAEYEANPSEFFERAYLEDNVADNFRVLPGIKNKTKLAFVLFTSILKKANCNFDPAGATIGAITVDVETLSAMIEVCQFELEQSFVVAEMSKGANGSYTPAAFMAHFWGQAALEINEEIQLLRWGGDTDGTFDDDNEFLKLADGIEKKLAAAEVGTTATLTGGTVDGSAATVSVVVGKSGKILAVNVLTAGDYSAAPTTVTLANIGEGEGATFSIQTTGSSPNITVTGVTVLTGGAGYNQKVVTVSGTTLSQTNILTEMGKVFAALPRRIRRRKDLLRWHVSPATADLYRLATASGNTMAFITKSLDLTYLDIRLVVNDGQSDDTMVLTRKDNLVYAFDADGDAKSLQLVDMMKSTAEPLLRARTNLRVGFFAVNEAEIVWYRKP
jgi:hypothetical protein